MIPAWTADEFRDAPVGRYFLGGRHIVFCHSAKLLGHASWGRPDGADVRAMLELCRIGIPRVAVPHVYLADLRGLEFVDPTTFGLMVDYVRSNAARLRRNVQKLVQIRPDGLAGAIVSGFSTIARAPFPALVCATVDEALEHLGVSTDEGRALLVQLSEIRNASVAKHEPVVRLRALLEEEGTCSLERAARALGLSTRALQRSLKESGTSYREELRNVRLHRAMTLLRDPSQQVTWIAVELGFSSLQHFVTMFRHATGETPREWRTRHASARTTGWMPCFAQPRPP